MMGRPVAPLEAPVEINVGAVVSAVRPVVKLQLKSAAFAMPARLLTAVVIVAVYRLFTARALDGVKTAVNPAYVIVPVTAVANGPVTLKAAGAVVVAGSIASLNVAVILLLICTPVSRFAGTVEVTVGAELTVAGTIAAPGIIPSSSAHPAIKTASSNVANHIVEILIAYTSLVSMHYAYKTDGSLVKIAQF